MRHYSKKRLMAKPSSRILVINDEHLVLREFVKGLNAAARTLDNPARHQLHRRHHREGSAGA